MCLYSILKIVIFSAPIKEIARRTQRNLRADLPYVWTSKHFISRRILMPHTYLFICLVGLTPYPVGKAPTIIYSILYSSPFFNLSKTPSFQSSIDKFPKYSNCRLCNMQSFSFFRSLVFCLSSFIASSFGIAHFRLPIGILWFFDLLPLDVRHRPS